MLRRLRHPNVVNFQGLCVTGALGGLLRRGRRRGRLRQQGALRWRLREPRAGRAPPAPTAPPQRACRGHAGERGILLMEYAAGRDLDASMHARSRATGQRIFDWWARCGAAPRGAAPRRLLPSRRWGRLGCRARGGGAAAASARQPRRAGGETGLLPRQPASLPAGTAGGAGWPRTWPPAWPTCTASERLALIWGAKRGLCLGGTQPGWRFVGASRGACAAWGGLHPHQRSPSPACWPTGHSLTEAPPRACPLQPHPAPGPQARQRAAGAGRYRQGEAGRGRARQGRAACSRSARGACSQRGVGVRKQRCTTSL